MGHYNEIGTLLAERVAGHSLPQGLYNDETAFRFDLEAIFARSWLAVGAECEVPEPGARLAISIGEWPILIVRGRDDRLRAFHNSCRHRGARLCADGRGQSNRLTCPYHGWSYDSDGALFYARRMPDDFDPAAHGLSPIALETVAGTIYICLSDTPPDFAPFRDQFTPLLAPHNLARAKLAHEEVLIEKANWKLVMENARECYHCPTAHPELTVSFPINVSHYFDYGPASPMAQFSARMEQAGLPVGPVGGEWWQATRFPLNEGCRSFTLDGAPAVSKLMCDAGAGDIGSMRWALEPNMFAHAHGDYAFLFTAWPIGPRETKVIGKWFVHQDAREGRDYDLERLTALWHITNQQDRDLAENNQQGVNARGYQPGPYSPMAEALVIRFADWYCTQAAHYLAEQAGGTHGG